MKNAVVIGSLEELVFSFPLVIGKESFIRDRIYMDVFGRADRRFPEKGVVSGGVGGVEGI